MQKQDVLMARLRSGDSLSWGQQLSLTVQLSLPAIMAQLSSIIMQYIDASMVGQLGANDSASIGLVASTTWLFGGLCSALSTGFMVLVAQNIGARKEKEARSIVKQGLAVGLGFSSLLALLGGGISGHLPLWLGGTPEICAGASMYFLIYALALPFTLLNNMAGSMLQASGNMRVPGFLNVMMCFLDIVFNALLIFPSGTFWVLPGAGLGVAGAALGTALSHVCAALLMVFALLGRSPTLGLRRGEGFAFERTQLTRAVKIALPVAVEQVIIAGARVACTIVVAPLGTVAIAANSFGITAESLCYMPGYGIGAAATTLIGQSIGAKRKDLTYHLAWLTTLLGMAVMTFSGALMYLFAPQMIGLLSPDPAIRALGTSILRIEAFAEPLYAASIVANCVMRGAGDTLVPSALNLVCMWAVRVSLSAFLAPRYGLQGVWFAMSFELCVRGGLFLVRLAMRRWERSAIE